MIRYTVRLADGRLFHFLERARADRFAQRHGGELVPFSVEMLAAELRAIIAGPEEHGRPGIRAGGRWSGAGSGRG